MKRILIIDDDHDMASLIQSLLKYYGYDATVVHDPHKGLTLAQKSKPDLILLDVLMPKMNGREVCEKLKQSGATKNIPVIFLTAKDSADDVAAELKVGGMGHITKPFDSKDLLEKIRDLC